MTSTSAHKIILYFVRHGESVENLNRTILLPSEDILTPKGEGQDAGNYEGKSYQEVLVDVIRTKVPIPDNIIPGGEALEDIYKRLDNFLEETFTDLVNEKSVRDQNVLIVSHFFCLHHLMSYLEKCDKYSLVNWSNACRKIMGNTRYTKIQLSQLEDKSGPGKWKLELLETQQKSLLGDEGILDSERNNAIVRKIMDQLGPAEEGLSECIQA